MDGIVGSRQSRLALRLQSEGKVSRPLLLIAFAGPNSCTFCEKSLLAPSLWLFVAGMRRLFGLVPAAKELLRRSLVALFHVADACNVVGVSGRFRKERGSQPS